MLKIDGCHFKIAVAISTDIHTHKRNLQDNVMCVSTLDPCADKQNCVLAA